MSARWKSHASFFKLLSVQGSRTLKAVLSTINRQQLKALCEILLNVYAGNIPVTKNILEKLRPYKRNIEILVARDTSFKTKRELLVKKYKLVQLFLKKALRYVQGNDSRSSREVSRSAQSE